MIFSKIDFNDEEPLYVQIENYIKNMIASNLLVSNGKLPATRELSKLLGVSRNSVITAYENLEEKGIIPTGKPYKIIVDRTEGIKYAIEIAKKGDIIVIPGLGHDLYLERNGVKHPYNERVVISQIIDEMIKNGVKK